MLDLNHIESAVQIDQPVDVVFQFLTTVSNHSRWHQRVLSAKQTSNGPLLVGSTWQALLHSIGQRRPRPLDFVVTEYERDHRFASWTNTPVFAMESAYQLQRQGTSTRVVCIREIAPHGLWNLVAPLFRQLIRKEICAESQALKTTVEASCPARTYAMV